MSLDKTFTILKRFTLHFKAILINHSLTKSVTEITEFSTTGTQVLCLNFIQQMLYVGITAHGIT